MTGPTRIVGLTGGMGAGKSTLVPVIREAGIPILDIDELVRDIYGDEMFCMDLDDEWGLVKGQDIKAQMAAMITQFPQRLSRLEEIISPWMVSGMNDFVKRHYSSQFIVMDAPILFEAKWDARCDFTIGVQCSIEIRKERVMQRPGMVNEKMEVLMARQISEHDRLNRCDFVISTETNVDESKLVMVQTIKWLKDFYNVYDGSVCRVV